MTTTLADLRTETFQRLGDSAGSIWTGAELTNYIQEGYDQLTRRTGCLLGVALAPDYAFAFSYTAQWEYDYILAVSGWWADGPAQFTYEFERDLIDNADGPANHNHHWEFNDSAGWVTLTEVSALVDLPSDLFEIERSTWNTRRISALRSRYFEEEDSRYERNKGQVEAYIQDKDGLDRLRKWRVPSTAYVPYGFDDGTDLLAFTTTLPWESTYLPTGAAANGPAAFTGGDDFPFIVSGDNGPADHNYLWEVTQGYVTAQIPNDDGYGIIRDLTGIVTLSVVSDGFGDLVQVDGVNVFEDYGILGPVYKETSNVRIEYRRRGLALSDTQAFEIPDRYTVYVRHFAMARSLEREGPGQELELAAHYQARFESGVQRMLKRKEALQFQRLLVMGGAPSVRGKKPMVRMPWAYGRVVR